MPVAVSCQGSANTNLRLIVGGEYSIIRVPTLVVMRRNYEYYIEVTVIYFRGRGRGPY